MTVPSSIATLVLRAGARRRARSCRSLPRSPGTVPARSAAPCPGRGANRGDARRHGPLCRFRGRQAGGLDQVGGDEPLMGEHWSPPRRLGWPDYQGPQARLDFARPNNLIYASIGCKRVLTGAAFIVRLAPGEPLPEGFAGSADRWHVHDMKQAIAAAIERGPMLRWLASRRLDSSYRDKGTTRARLAMDHVWAALPNPDGAFANHNRTVPYLKHGLPRRCAPDRRCRGRAEAAVERACASAAREVAAALASHRAHPAMLDAAAAETWLSFERAWESQLSAEQRARIFAITEHGQHHLWQRAFKGRDSGRTWAARPAPPPRSGRRPSGREAAAGRLRDRRAWRSGCPPGLAGHSR